MASGTTIANAYVQILPSMQGMSGELQSQMEGPAEEAGASGGSKAGASFVKSLGKALVALGIGKVIGEAISGAADLQQSVGGVETLFGDAASTVIDNANMAFQTAGLSANEYMETVTSFSASLLQSLGGDTAAAASAADQALTDMSDNANKMGTDMTMIQNAYQGFARQNYTMLDNLKLGYGGTQSEMERLLADASALSGVEYNIDNLSDVYEAIHVIQTEMGITGTTAEEASSTMTGSLNMVKASATNLLASLASGEGVGTALQQFGEAGITAIQNFMPALVSTIVEMIPALFTLLSEFGPQLVELAVQGVTDIIAGLVAALPILIEAIGNIVTTLIPAVIAQIPVIVQALMDALPTLITGLISMVLGIVEALPTIIQALIDALPTIISSIITGLMTALPQLVAGLVDLVIALVGALPEIITALIEAIPVIIESLVGTIVDEWPQFKQGFLDIFNNLRDNFPEIMANFVAKVEEEVKALGTTIGTLVGNFMDAVGEWVDSMWEKLQDAWPEFVESVKEFVSDLPGNITEALSDIGEVGSNIISGIWQGIQDGWDWLVGQVQSFASSLIEAAKSALGIASPSKEFAWVGEMVTAGLGKGLEDTSPIESALDDVIGLTTGTLAPELLLGGMGSVSSGISNGAGYSIVNSFTINGAEGQDVMEIANAVRDVLNDEFDETEAVYA